MVPLITTREILQVTAPQSGQSPILVDVRSIAERSVSYIPGSVSVAEFENLDWSNMKDRCIIPYCTIGMRSGMYGTKLRSLGFNNVRNGEGILLWTHAASVVRKVSSLSLCGTNEEPTKEVHVFSSDFNLIADSYVPVVFSFLEVYWYGWKCWWYGSFEV